MNRVRTLAGLVCSLGLCLAAGTPQARAAEARSRPLVRLLPPSEDAAATSAEIPGNREPRLSRGRLLDLLHKRVKYVFVLFQENRSFDFCFGSFPGVDGLYSRPGHPGPGFTQFLDNPDGSRTAVTPFLIGPREYAADLDDVGHAHGLMDDKMDVVDGAPHMDRFALAEEEKRAHGGTLTLKDKQFGELTMAHVDGDTIPFLWRWANRFVVCDQVFQLIVGPSTPGAISVLAAQAGQTQAALHPEELAKGRGDKGPGEPVLNDSAPLWGSPRDSSPSKPPVNPKDFAGKSKDVAFNQTYASLPLSLAGSQAGSRTSDDPAKGGDLKDLGADLAYLGRDGQPAFSWGWYQEGYGGSDHSAYVAHHNGAQYFGYIVHSPAMASGIHDLKDLFPDLSRGALSEAGGVYYVRGGKRNPFGLAPADPDLAARGKFLGDDDHPGSGDSDSQIAEALLARTVNAIARSRYWSQCAIIITYDESGGWYDHVPPPVRAMGPGHLVLGDGPRIPLLVISPFARAHSVLSEPGDQGSVVKFADAVFRLTPLAQLPDELKGRKLGMKRWGQDNWGPDDADTRGVSDLVDALDPARLAGQAPPLPTSYAVIPDNIVDSLPRASGYGLKDIGVVPTGRGLPDPIPADFNPRPETDPTQNGQAAQ